MREFSPNEEFAARKMAEVDFYFFCRWMFYKRKKYKFLRGKHHKAICDALVRVFKGECKRLIINIPPRYSKTELLLNWVAWCLGHVPDSEFIFTSFSSQLATNNSWQAREIVLHEAYADIFPNTVLKHDSTAKHDWKTTENGTVYAAGAGGTITGYGAGKQRQGFGGAIIIDDPHKPSEAGSDVIRKGVLDWFQNTLESRKNDPLNTPIILIMQRLHEEDLAGWLLNGGNNEEWEHISMPALDEDTGEALWPEKHTVAMLEKMKAANPYVFSGQYQQRPSPLGGGLLKGSWFKRYKQIPRLTQRVIFADTAQKTAEHNDYSVFQCWGKGEDGNAYFLDQIRGKWESPELKRRSTDFWQKHIAVDPVLYGSLVAMKVEDKASGTGLIQDLRISSSIPVLPIERVKDKLTRVTDITGYVEAGRVYIPEEAEWVSEFIQECEAFTPNDTHKHDDQIDPLCDAITDLVAVDNLIDVWSKLSE